MPRVKFTATKAIKIYMGKGLVISDGGEVDVDADLAKYLTETFPSNFVMVDMAETAAPHDMAEKGSRGKQGARR
jgi:hypothetical protein